MTDVGSQLRGAREAQGLTIEQAYKATRIKAVYLEAIEANRMSALPGPVQARGFVRSYANFLGLDGEALASALDAVPVLVAQVQSSAAVKPTPIKPTTPTVLVKPLAPAPDRAVPRTRTLELPSLPKISVPTTRDTSPASPGGVPTLVLVIGAIVLFAVGLLLIISALTSAAKPAPSRPFDVNLPAAVKPDLALATSEIVTNVGPVSITVMADEHVWVRVLLDGQTVHEGMLQPGSSQSWSAADQVIIETGNAAAIHVDYNGRSSPLGARGQIVARAWTHTGVEDVPVAASTNNTRPGVQGAPASISTSIVRP
jgi:cytoskeleton protein RodZ